MYNEIKPSVELITETGLEKIELIGKVCTKREDTIKDGTAKQFVINRIKDGHLAILMHEYVYFDVSKVDHEFKVQLAAYNPYIEWSNDLCYIAINYRTFIDMIVNSKRAFKRSKFVTDDELISDWVFSLFAKTEEFSSLFYTAYDLENNFITGGIENYFYINSERVTPDHIKEHANEIFVVTLKFTCDRGITHEIVRHTEMAFMQESTRWCNYAKGKNGNGINIIVAPVDYPENNGYDKKLYTDTISDLGGVYNELVKEYGWKPEEARSILPTATKADIYVTATVEKWLGEIVEEKLGNISIYEPKGFLPLRTAKNAHFQMRPFAIKASELIETVAKLY